MASKYCHLNANKNNNEKVNKNSALFLSFTAKRAADMQIIARSLKN